MAPPRTKLAKGKVAHSKVVTKPKTGRTAQLRAKAEERLTRSSRMDAMESYDAHEVSEVSEDDDEELDDEEAFDDEDEERFGALFANAKKSAKKGNDESLLNEGSTKRKHADDDEEDEEDEEDEDEEDWGSDDGEMVDFSELLSAGPSKAIPVNPEYSLKKKPAKSSDPKDPTDILMSKHESLSDDNDSEESDALYDSEDDTTSAPKDDEDDRMQSFVSNLDKRSAKKRRTLLNESTEAYTESEFNLNALSRATASGSAKLDFTDLVGSLTTDSTFTNLRKQLTELAPGVVDTRPGKPGLRAAGTEAAPLPTRIQDRIGRVAAYSEAKREVDKWTGAVSKNRKAEQLDFSKFEEAPSAVVSSASLVGQFKPSNAMEQQIAQILNESALSEKKQMELEDLEMNKFSIEEMEEKRRELVKLRSLAFYAEQKSKKIAKIKSKTYRKIHKKDADRKAAKDGSGLTLEELKDLDPDAAREKAEKMHAERIKERMTQKHKSTGKWAKKMLARGDHGDANTRQALMDQLNKSHDLTRKIAGLESDEDSDALNSSSDEDDNEDIESGGRAKRRGEAAFNALEEQMELDEEENAPTKGLYAMKFMQRGLENQRKESRALLEEARREMEEEEEDSDDSEAGRKVAKKEAKKLGGVGRMVFGAAAEEDDDVDREESDVEVDEDGGNKVSSAQFNMKLAKPIAISVGGKSSTFSVAEEKTAFSAKISNAKFGDEPAVSVPSKKSKKSKATPEPIPTPTITTTTKSSKKSAPETDESNPWLTTTSATQKSTKLNTTHADKAMEKMNKVKQLQRESETMEEVDVTLNLDGVRKLEVVKPQQKQAVVVSEETGKKGKKGKSNASIAGTSTEATFGPQKPATSAKPKPVISYDSDEDSDEDATAYKNISDNFVHASDLQSLTQRELMQIAFANDNVAAEFEDEKEKVVKEDAPEVVDNTLPGWGSWAGDGVAPKTNLVTSLKSKPDSIAATKRKDAKLAHVLINEKRVRNAAKYLAKDLPFGYESREQYEQAIRMPLGVEWNTTSSHARLTAPKVVTKMGTVINPLRLTAKSSGAKANRKEATFKTKK
ncbi:hypothetical protein HDU98_004840 [Podochytrium sp. JEL0797]|nr:hypothetical protein HDU98_004840 [Podochytrium sp. JEL0797]